MNADIGQRITATEGLAFNSLMGLIQWGDHFKVGRPVIDDQHERIFELAIDAARLSRSPADIERLRAVFDEFGATLKRHFGEEEAELASWGYEKLDEHRGQHRAMLSEFEFINQRLAANGEGWAFQEEALVVVNFMIGVTVGHILHSDADYARAVPVV